MPPGLTFADSFGNTWTVAGGGIVTYFFVGPITSVPILMEQGWDGVYGTFGGHLGWIIAYS